MKAKKPRPEDEESLEWECQHLKQYVLQGTQSPYPNPDKIFKTIYTCNACGRMVQPVKYEDVY